ncbi:MAG: hypothetical protein IPK16_09855 [Anaerolineales bacterium]|nr:hypothetical protein [Anaerolineales bacterium]
MVDVLVTVGQLGAAIAEEALAVQFDPKKVHMMAGPDDTVALLREIVRPGDLVLVKGSRAVGMDVIVPEITGDNASGATGARKAQG